MTTVSACPACDHPVDETDRVLHVDEVPAVGTRLWPTSDEARRAPRGTIDLVLCRYCGLVYNRAFDSTLVAYEPGYENSQLFSPAFRRYARALAKRLVATYHLHAYDVVVEIGCGHGEFLGILCDEGRTRGYGFDAAYEGPVRDPSTGAGVNFVAEPYDAGEATIEADLICCRHVLEHLPDPATLLAATRTYRAGTPVPVYAEVPNAEFVFTSSGLWDVIYQHVSYFTESALRPLLERCGFEVVRAGSGFAGQMLGVDARPMAMGMPDASAPARDPEVVGAAHGLARRYEETVAYWNDRLGQAASRGDNVALWGAGSKGVSFLNATSAQGVVDRVVDVNPRKVDRFLPVSGHRVGAPESLQAEPPATVVVANAVYEPEVRDRLAALELAPEVVSL